MIIFPTIDKKINDRVPIITYLLLATNTFIFISYIFTFTSVEVMINFFRKWGLVPAQINLFNLFSHMFIHADGAHLAINMFFLWFFGKNVERRLGSIFYIAFYLIAGIVSALLFVAFNLGSKVPLVGASGAISGVMGMYLAFFPKREVELFYFAIISAGTFRIPAYLFLCLYFLLELIYAIFFTGLVAVAHIAHAGGFGAGVLLALPLTAIGAYLGKEVYKPFEEEEIAQQEAEKLIEVPTTVMKYLRQESPASNPHPDPSIKNRGIPLLEIVSEINFSEFQEVAISTASGDTYLISSGDIVLISAGKIAGKYNSLVIDIFTKEPVKDFRIDTNNYRRMDFHKIAKLLVIHLAGVEFTSDFVNLVRDEAESMRPYNDLQEYDSDCLAKLSS